MSSMKMGLQLEMSQQLIMTPQLQQAIKLLQLSRHELEELIDQSLIENPTLEISPVEKEDSDVNDQEEVHLDNASNLLEEQQQLTYDDEWQRYLESGGGVIQEARNVSKDFDEESNFLENTISNSNTLSEHLLHQLDISDLHPIEFEIGERIIGNIDEDGYLSTSLREILAISKEVYELIEQGIKQGLFKKDDLSNMKTPHLYDTKHETSNSRKKESKRKKKELPTFAEEAVQTISNWTTIDEISDEFCGYLERVLEKIQRLDPPGVGARNLQECLKLQLIYIGLQDSLAYKIIQQNINFLQKKDLQRIAKKQKVTLEQTIQAYQIITELEPKPGRPFDPKITQYVIPDVYIYKQNQEYVVVLNQDSLPKLRINPYYQKIASQNGIYKLDETKSKNVSPNPETPIKKRANEDMTNEYLIEKIKSGEWLMKSIEQRQKTIYKVAKSILKYQQEFFEKGIDYLKPLVLKDVAEDIDVHESTVSRITTNKYAHTPQGIFELKYFFTSGIVQEDGDVISSKKIKDYIKKLVESEDPKKPYTDIQMAQKLIEDADIKVARRTVAKYREALNILSSSKRKQLF